jgi:hypothetical protein
VLWLTLTAPVAAQDDTEAKAAALAERARTGESNVVADLVALLEHQDWRVRWQALRGIGLERADWLDERVATLLDDEPVAPMAAFVLDQLVGKQNRWPPLDRAAELVAAAKEWWHEQQAAGEGWVTHRVLLAPDLGTTVRGQMHAERGTAYLVVQDGKTDRERTRLRWSGPIRALAFSADSRRFAASDDRGNVVGSGHQGGSGVVVGHYHQVLNSHNVNSAIAVE